MTRITITIDVEGSAAVTMGAQPARATQTPDTGGPLQDALEAMPEPVWDGVETLPAAAVKAFPDAKVTAVPTALNACPIHHTPWKTVPAGVSKKTGKPYSAFQVCSEKGCEQRPAA